MVDMLIEMLSIVTPLVAGILLGFLLRNRKRVDLGKVTFAAIVVLIFSMGFTIGSDNELLASMPQIGFNAVVLLASALFFSVIFVKVARKMVKLE